MVVKLVGFTLVFLICKRNILLSRFFLPADFMKQHKTLGKMRKAKKNLSIIDLKPTKDYKVFC